MTFVVLRTVFSVFAGRRRLQTVATAALLILAVATLRTLGRDADLRYPFRSKDGKGKQPILALPSDYDPFLEGAPSQSQYCAERYTPSFFDDFRSHPIQYCAAGSPASLYCFQGHTRADNVVDSLCIGQGARLDVARQRVHLDCELRPLDINDTSRGLIPFDAIRGEWYDSGPRFVLDNWVTVERDPSAPAPSAAVQAGDHPQFTILAKRECSANIWHCMMEIWSMTLTFDLLRTTPDPSRGDGTPFYSDIPDFPNTQVLLLDEHSEGNFLDLWTIFTGRPILRWKDLLADADAARAFAATPRNVIIPLAGAANPLWQNDWVDHDCGYAPLLKAFVHRVLRFHSIFTTTPAPLPPTTTSPPPLNLTYINRTGSRQLLDHEALLSAVSARHQNVHIHSIDFATLSFADQLRLVHETDVLLGVHGAGLTHTMFMREGRGAVVEIRPATNDYRGFRNLAVMKGLGYFTAHGEQVGKEGREKGGEEGDRKKRELWKRASWHWDDVRVEREAFLELMDGAIEAAEKSVIGGK
ncbi:hypothetical protein C8A05DRAFT_19317 [Staphylotrichum tortipilum]|uniref:EGF domain-specific O-linked N-acetylglucosamine transferase n=1 Tax=Staphylotrichum tortipilum TaxID=2831512 RepID=A0AAN6MBV4_9PEZI|nr:hypothetical protein C8A05DRAFT_19317 [Staphylotrichum longicolle]